MDKQIVSGIFRIGAIGVCIFAYENAAAQIGPIGPGVVPIPSYYESVTANDSQGSHSQYGTSPYNVTNGVATAGTLYTGPDGGTASLSIKAGSSAQQFASASVMWQFVVLGPSSPFKIIPIYLSGLGMLSVTSTNSLTTDDANATVYSNSFGTLSQDLSHNGQSNFGISTGAYILPDTFYSITETVSGYSISPGGVTDLIKASIDPNVEFAAGWENSAGYTIAVSPEVPEPPTVALMLGGFGFLIARKLRSQAS